MLVKQIRLFHCEDVIASIYARMQGDRFSRFYRRSLCRSVVTFTNYERNRATEQMLSGTFRLVIDLRPAPPSLLEECPNQLR